MDITLADRKTRHTDPDKRCACAETPRPVYARSLRAKIGQGANGRNLVIPQALNEWQVPGDDRPNLNGKDEGRFLPTDFEATPNATANVLLGVVCRQSAYGSERRKVVICQMADWVIHAPAGTDGAEASKEPEVNGQIFPLVVDRLHHRLFVLDRRVPYIASQ